MKVLAKANADTARDNGKKLAIKRVRGGVPVQSSVKGGMAIKIAVKF
jgi:hypothetical protein